MSHEFYLTLNATMKDCIVQCEDLGIKVGNVKSVNINPRLTKTAGKCKEYKLGNLKYFTIEVALFTMEQSQEFIADTIMHELLHTVDGCFDHGMGWHDVVSQVNNAYGYNITTTYSDKDLLGTGMVKSEPKYIISCITPGCDMLTTKETRVPLVKEPECYACGICGNTGTLKVTHNGEVIAGAGSAVKKKKVAKYKITCKGCGLFQEASRAGKMIKNITDYTCGSCGCSLEVTQNY